MEHKIFKAFLITIFAAFGFLVFFTSPAFLEAPSEPPPPGAAPIGEPRPLAEGSGISLSMFRQGEVMNLTFQKINDHHGCDYLGYYDSRNFIMIIRGLADDKIRSVRFERKPKKITRIPKDREYEMSQILIGDLSRYFDIQHE